MATMAPPPTGDLSLGCYHRTPRSGEAVWTRIDVAEYRAALGTWIVGGRFGDLLLSGVGSNADRAAAILRRAAAAAAGAAADATAPPRRPGVFTVPTVRHGPQTLVCGPPAVYRGCPPALRAGHPDPFGMLDRLRRPSTDGTDDAPSPAAAVAPGAFREAFRLQAGGASSLVIRVGTHRSADGAVVRDAVEKTVDRSDIAGRCATQAGCPLVRRLEWLRRHADGARGVVRVLATGMRGPGRPLVYTEWYALGDLRGAARERFTAAELGAILGDPWDGLHWLNALQGLLHGDIKPGNVFVGIRDGVPRGVLGDVGRAVPGPGAARWGRDRPGAQLPRGRTVVGLHPALRLSPGVAVCPGDRGPAPFRLCDPRRDQTALLVTSLSALTGLGWSEHCAARVPRDRLSWGHVAPRTGRSGGFGYPMDSGVWVDGVYASYARSLAARGAIRTDSLWYAALAMLDDRSERRFATRWGYTALFRGVRSALRALADRRTD